MAEETVEETAKADRPIAITLISIFLVVGNPLLVWYLFCGTLLQGRGMGESIYFVFTVVVSIACGIGLWMMKKWAVYAYAVLGVIIQIVLLLPVIGVFFGYRNLSKMS